MGDDSLRYFLSEQQKSEIPARTKYLYHVFQLYFIMHEVTDGFVPLVPIGTAEPSVLFIIGHQDKVNQYVRGHLPEIYEKHIVMITCSLRSNPEWVLPNRLGNKALYISRANKSGSCHYYDGSDYNLDFNVTASELDLYNSHESDLMKRIQSCFQRI